MAKQKGVGTVWTIKTTALTVLSVKPVFESRQWTGRLSTLHQIRLIFPWRELQMLNLSDIGSVPDYFSGRNVITGNAALLPLSPVGCDDPIASGADRKSTAAIVDATQFGQGIAGIQAPDFEPARFEKPVATRTGAFRAT